MARTDFRRLEDLGPSGLQGVPDGVSISPVYADITDQLERMIMGVTLYESQLERLFDSTDEMAMAVRAHGHAIAELGSVAGAAERYWVSGRA